MSNHYNDNKVTFLKKSLVGFRSFLILMLPVISFYLVSQHMIKITASDASNSYFFISILFSDVSFVVATICTLAAIALSIKNSANFEKLAAITLDLNFFKLIAFSLLQMAPIIVMLSLTFVAGHIFVDYGFWPKVDGLSDLNSLQQPLIASFFFFTATVGLVNLSATLTYALVKDNNTTNNAPSLGENNV